MFTLPQVSSQIRLHKCPYVTLTEPDPASQSLQHHWPESIYANRAESPPWEQTPLCVPQPVGLDTSQSRSWVRRRHRRPRGPAPFPECTRGRGDAAGRPHLSAGAPSCGLRRDPWPPAELLPIPGPQTLPVSAAAVSPRFFWKRETPEDSPRSSGPFPSLQARVKLTLLPLPEGPALALWAWISRSPGPARETLRGSPVSLGPPFPPLYSGGDLAHRGAPGDVCTRSWLSRCVGGW